jgi:hypothetical protein
VHVGRDGPAGARQEDLDLLVPAYVHPLEDPAAWHRLVALAPALRAVVVNVHNGPGADPDPSYVEVIDRVHEAGIRTVGYVDTAYGGRQAPEVVADVEGWVGRYGVRGVFFDQVWAGLDRLDHYADLTVAARARGADYVVLNPGAVPHPGYLDLANVTVTFEGSWEDYRRVGEPAWIRELPPARFAHLVHTAPDAGALHAALRIARCRHVRTVFVTTGAGANPWNLVPQALLTAFGPTAA